MKKLQTGNSWKLEILKTKPKFGIINGFGIECQSTIDQLFPRKVAMFINAFFTEGLKYIYLNIEKFEIEAPYVQREKFIHRTISTEE